MSLLSLTILASQSPVANGPQGDGFAIEWHGRLRVHGYFDDSQRTAARLSARTADYVWVRRGTKSYIVTDPKLIHKAFDAYQHADACADTTPRSSAGQARNGAVSCGAMMRRVWNVLEDAIQIGSAAAVR